MVPRNFLLFPAISRRRYNPSSTGGTHLANRDSSHQVTALLPAWRGNDENAFPRVIEAVYLELRTIARRYLRQERNNFSVQATALVHEAYFRLAEINQVSWQDRAHFFAIASKVMGRVLVDHARSRRRAKRGAGITPLDLDEALTVSTSVGREIVLLDEALDQLTKLDARKAQVVQMRYFGGLREKEIAVVLHVSTKSVCRGWQFAKAWLAHELGKKNCDGPATLGIN
jgi:RNA polymerase sigma factor (TIGR02999 family)